MKTANNKSEGIGLPILQGLLPIKGAQVMDDVKAQSRYKLRQLFGEDVFYDTLEDVVKAYRQETGTEVK